MLFYIKDKDRVYFTDVLLSDTERNSFDLKDYLLPSNIPIWNTGKDSEIVVAMYANKMGSYIRYIDCFNVEEFCPKKLIREVIPKLKDKIKAMCLWNDNALPNGLFVAKGDRVYRVSTGCGAYNEGDWFAIGTCACEAIAALKCSVGLPIKERIKKVVECVAKAGSFPAYPIAISDTVSRELQVFNGEEEFEKDFVPTT